MADHKYVDLVTGWLETEWDDTNYPGGYTGSTPAIVDQDDTDSKEFSGREVAYELADNNAVIVGSGPDRTQELIGTNPDYRFEDGVEIRVVAAHESEVAYPEETSSPGVSGSAEVRALYQEVRRILHTHTSWPDRNQSGSQHTHTLAIFDETNLSSQFADLYEYSITATVRGHEELP